MPANAYTLKETAKELGYALGTVYNKVNKGAIVVQRFEPDVRVFEEDNRELFAKRRAFLAGEKPT